MTVKRANNMPPANPCAYVRLIHTASLEDPPHAPDAIVHKPSAKLIISPLSTVWETAFGNSVFIVPIA